MLLIWPQAKLNQSPRIGNHFALPSIVSLKLLHGFLRGGVPRSGGFAGHIVIANQGFLNIARPLRVNFLLATHAGSFTRFAVLAMGGSLAGRGGVVRGRLLLVYGFGSGAGRGGISRCADNDANQNAEIERNCPPESL